MVAKPRQGRQNQGWQIFRRSAALALQRRPPRLAPWATFWRCSAANGLDSAPQKLNCALDTSVPPCQFVRRCKPPSLLCSVACFPWLCRGSRPSACLDQSFVDYFGQRGVDSIEEAIGILGNIPPVSDMSPDLTELPWDAKGKNALASAYGVLDLKSSTVALLVEQIGLANPERFVWSLRARTTFQGATQYSVVNLNYDPEPPAPSSYVNGVLYNYVILDALGSTGNAWASAIEWF